MTRIMKALLIGSFFVTTAFAESGKGANGIEGLTCNEILDLQINEASTFFGFPVPAIDKVIDLQVITNDGIQSFGALFTFQDLPVFYSSYWPLSLFCKWSTGTLRDKADGSTKMTGYMVPNGGDAQWFTGDLVPYNVPGFPDATGYWTATKLDPSSNSFFWGLYSVYSAIDWPCAASLMSTSDGGNKPVRLSPQQSKKLQQMKARVKRSNNKR